MIKFLFSPIGKVVWDLLDKPEDWDISDLSYKILHKPSESYFWTGNGGFFFDVRSYEDTDLKILGYFERHIIYYKAKRMLINRSDKIKSDVLKKLTGV
jgi:hypothetical protein